MADTATVQIEDGDVIEVDVTDLPEMPGNKVDPKPATSQVTPRTSATDTAAADLQAAIRAADDSKRAREAAEQTAATERRAREAAERRAAARDEENKRYRQAAEDNELAVINSGIDAAKQAQTSAQQEWQRAMEAGEFDKAAAAQTAIATASAQVVQLEADKAAAERSAKTKPASGAVERPVETTEPAFEQYMAKFTPKTQAWLRLHPDCVPPEVGGRPDRFNKTMAGHHDALAAGYAAESDEYFKMIEARLNPEATVTTATTDPASKAAETTAAVVDPKPTPRQRQAAPAAPVSRDAPAAAGQRTTRSVTLTKDQQEVARFTFPHLKPQEALAQYARNLLELEAEGKMGRLTH